jgi:hypothetical protein
VTATVKRYALFWLITGQPSNVAPGVLAVETVRPIAFGRVSRLIDGDGIVASRGWSVAAVSTVFALGLAVPAIGFATALELESSYRWKGPLLGACIIWMVGAVLSIISVADAWQNRAQPILAQPARPAQRA